MVDIKGRCWARGVPGVVMVRASGRESPGIFEMLGRGLLCALIPPQAGWLDALVIPRCRPLSVTMLERAGVAMCADVPAGCYQLSSRFIVAVSATMRAQICEMWWRESCEDPTNKREASAAVFNAKECGEMQYFHMRGKFMKTRRGKSSECEILKSDPYEEDSGSRGGLEFRGCIGYHGFSGGGLLSYSAYVEGFIGVWWGGVIGVHEQLEVERKSGQSSTRYRLRVAGYFDLLVSEICHGHLCGRKKLAARVTTENPRPAVRGGSERAGKLGREKIVYENLVRRGVARRAGARGERLTRAATSVGSAVR
ncbi:hypothetical protein GOBAR_DD28920 [Gossypium barbadense]|nr:hypothetical protein GOBAR_DD28920 [Gossypium barbadense]